MIVRICFDFCFPPCFIWWPHFSWVSVGDSIVFGCIPTQTKLQPRPSYLFVFEQFLCVSLTTMRAFTSFFWWNVRSLRLLSPVFSSFLAHIAPICPFLALISARSFFERSFCTFLDNFTSSSATFSDSCDYDSWHLSCVRPYLPIADPWHTK